MWQDRLLHCVVFTKTSEEFAPHYLAEIRHDMRQTTQTGVKLTKDAMQMVETQLQRLPGLEKWFVDIVPTSATVRAP